MRAAAETLPNGSKRIRVTHPLGGAHGQIACVAPTLGGAMVLAEHWRTLRRNYRHGLVSREEVLAEVARHKARAAASTGEDGGPVQLRVREIWEAYVAHQVSEASKRTLGSYGRSQLSSLLGLSPLDLTAERMETWNRELGKVYAFATIKNCLDALAAAIRRAMRRTGPLHGVLTELPWDDWRPSGGRDARERHVFPWVDVERLLERAHLEDERDAALGTLTARYPRLAVLVYGGLRNAELAALGWDDVQSLSTGEVRLHVRRQVDRGRWRARGEARPAAPPKGRRKGGKTRSLILHPAAVEALEAHRAALVQLGLYREDGPIFPGKGGDWRPREGLNAARLRALARRAGLDWSGALCTHSLRHGFCTHALAGGADIATVAAAAGHQDKAITWIYVGQTTGQGVPRPELPPVPTRAGVTHLLPLSGGAPRALVDAPARPTPLEQKHEDRGRFEAIWHRRREEILASATPAAHVPREVADLANDERRNARRRAVHRGEGAVEANAAGMRARRSFLGAWAKFVRRMIAAERAKGAA